MTEPPSPPEQGDLTPKELDRFLGESDPMDAGPVQPYLESAAVLVAFDVETLRPSRSTKVERAQALRTLLPLCEPAAYVSKPGSWSLDLPARRSTLEKMASRDKMRKALEANPERPDVALQRMLDAIILNLLEPLDRLSRDELAALLTVCEWLAGILENLPDPARVAETLARADLLAPMERLAGSGFVGRERELDQLSEYVSAPPPAAPLFVFGTGGVGKSTLLARYLLRDAAPQQVPFAYVDIDRPTIRPESPLTVLLDAIAQLRPQVGWSKESADPILKEITGLIARHEHGRDYESVSAYGWILQLFAQAFSQPLRGRTALLVVDTIEEAQFLGSDVVWGLMDFLFALQNALPQVRIVLAGRTLPEEYTSRAFPGLAPPEAAGEAQWLELVPLPGRPIDLGVLDEASARELLARALAETGALALTESELDDVIAIVSRNPMCLKLAARVLRDEGVDDLRADRARFLARLKAEKVQGLLYGRILRHVHGGDDVRRVAYPGLIVRRISAEVIREVLAGPCRLELRPEHDEHAIFEALRREAALMVVDPEDGSLRHRIDVRRVMLQDLTDEVDEDVVSAIDTNAVRHYEGRSDAVSRAEEIYHRLRRREEESALDARWMPEAGSRLKSALDEVPARQRLWLASKLSVTLDPLTRQTADQEAWESQAARSAERYMQAGSPEQALKVLQERAERTPRSRLPLVEIEVYRFLGKFDRALEVAHQALESASRAGDTDLALSLLLKMAAIEEGRGRLPAAEDTVDRAAALTLHTSNRVHRLRVAASKLRLQRQLRPADRSERAALRKRALELVDDEMLHKLREHPVLLREVAAELGKQDSRIAALAIETLGIEVETDAQAKALAKAIVNLSPRETSPSKAVVIGGQMFRDSKFDLNVIRKWATEDVTQRDIRRIGRTLAEAETGDKVLSGFREYFRAGVTSALGGGSKAKTIRLETERGLGRRGGHSGGTAL